MYNSIDQAAHALQRKLVKYKERRQDGWHGGAAMSDDLLAALEALASGKPVLGGNQDGARDALGQGELGVLVNPDDVTEIGKTIVEILKRSHEHSLLYHPQKLREKVIQKFGLDVFQNTLANLLQQLFLEIK